jgi:hypothetical protein
MSEFRVVLSCASTSRAGFLRQIYEWLQANQIAGLRVRGRSRFGPGPASSAAVSYLPLTLPQRGLLDLRWSTCRLIFREVQSKEEVSKQTDWVLIAEGFTAKLSL